MLRMEYFDLDEARDVLGRMASLVLVEPSETRKFHMQGRFLETDKVRIYRASTMTGYLARYDGDLDDFVFSIQRRTLNLNALSTFSDTNAEATLFLDRRDADRKSMSAMSSQKGVLIDADTLTRAVSDRLGDGDLNRIKFSAGATSPALHLSCEGICDALYNGLSDHGGLVGNSLAVANLHDALINTILYSANHSYSEVLRRGSVELPRVVRRAVDFINANAHLPITPTDVAVACGMSIRSLQLTFRERFETTPSLYIRKTRLKRAYDDLRAGDRPSIGDIARRWGFLSPGEFARLFKAEFGERPGDVFRR
ncbi:MULTISPECIES: helix-turn-helix transcriptional regulator [unclassified Rhizobium]|uniref:helix-turn-helix transcriptional regulator n=1 Tax=Rhizobium sp. PP-CC-3G-465 TaxID=2135648 RepID=UPI00104D8AD7|nr:AraC-like DNA-binding protein [Rhizobium sp. PP-CC-2G-626]TCQ19369.1 AraC-like DNA-binding protein [Rhizobium sp. PP-CC-3G-465]